VAGAELVATEALARMDLTPVQAARRGLVVWTVGDALVAALLRAAAIRDPARAAGLLARLPVIPLLRGSIRRLVSPNRRQQKSGRASANARIAAPRAIAAKVSEFRNIVRAMLRYLLHVLDIVMTRSHDSCVPSQRALPARQHQRRPREVEATGDLFRKDG
jgi:hypothetical protein